MSHTFIMTVLVPYVATTALYLYYFSAQSRSAEKAGLALLAVGFTAHTALLIGSYITLGRFPVIDLKESLCFFSWSLVALYLIVRLRTPSGALGVFVGPLATGFFIAACSITSPDRAPDARFMTALFPVHILFAFLGHAAFAFAGGSSIMYLLQERGLKEHRPGPFLRRLPSLQQLDAMNYHSLTVGFFMLSLGIFTGALWLHNVEGRFLKWDPKVLASVVTWLLYAVIMHTRLIVGWRGRRTAILSIIGFCCVLLTFLGMGLIKPGFHNFL